MSKASRAINIDDLRTLAKARLPRMVFDYIDGGAEDEITLRRSVDRYADYELQWNSLVDIFLNDTATT
ncbi:alpha-hydroxy-acid oxidizing protein, partial [Hyphomonas sp.]|uniref:alpha-hydroxy-acid oxidizing protein n=1 Tax=Hyphomonas sp. TaxID=87 RepID=UPI003241DEDE